MLAGKLQLIGGGENVGRFKVRMNKAMAVEIDENVEHRFKHIGGFGSRERAVGENLGEILFGMRHHDVETIPVAEAATADDVDAQQVGMRQRHNAGQERERQIGG